jgi:hypothetical protein
VLTLFQGFADINKPEDTSAEVKLIYNTIFENVHNRFF